ncbi:MULTISPECIES: hypothetical protein [Actinomycetes]|uniref:hypothetical protein n=1 Tax=Actinomycetes TaxID=1760 RepID=UPI0004C1108A|nr:MULTISPECIES: hypothetical protein [Actinomycetes]
MGALRLGGLWPKDEVGASGFGVVGEGAASGAAGGFSVGVDQVLSGVIEEVGGIVGNAHWWRSFG